MSIYPELAMDNNLTAHEKIIVNARKVAETTLRERACLVDSSAHFPVEGVKALYDHGLMALMSPKAYGGQEVDLGTFVEVASILAGECLSTALVWSMHSQQVAVVAQHANLELKEKILRSVAERGAFVASATTEAKGGGHILTCSAAAEERDEGLHIERFSPIVTGGEYAEWFIATIRTSKDIPLNEVSLVAIHKDDTHLVDEKNSWNVMGVRGTRSIAVQLSCALDEGDFIGEKGKFKNVALNPMIPLGHIAWSACWYGAIWRAYKVMMKHLREKGAHGGADLKSDLIAERIAQVRLEIDSVKAFLMYSVAEYNKVLDVKDNTYDGFADTSFNILINNLKVMVSEHAFTAIDKMVQIAGIKTGYSTGAHIERVFRDLRSARLMYANDKLIVASGKLSFSEKTRAI